MESIEEPNISAQEIIRKDFLDGKITAAEFGEKWIQLDQSGTHVEQAAINIKIFGDKAVREKVVKLGGDFENKYNAYMALSYFHKAQGDKAGGALRLPDFKKALEYSMKNSADEKYQDTIKYKEGTVAYFEKDIEVLENIIFELKQNPPSRMDVNTKILQRMVASLKNGDEPEESYMNVYFNH